MRAVVKADDTTRVITIGVVEAPDLGITRPWHSKIRSIRPDTVELVLLQGRVRKATVYGGLVLKSGRVSGSARHHRQWWSSSGNLADGTDMPGWVRELWDSAPTGVRDWSIMVDLT
jgi:hypothetical protein